MPSLVKNVVNWSHTFRTQPSPPQLDLCDICGKKPKFVDNGFKHPYCSRSCARNVQGGAGPTACALRGCRATGKPAFANFCSDAHAREGVKLGRVEGCEHCRLQPRSVGTLCIPCDRATRGGPRLRELNPDGATFKNLRTQFLSEWEGGDTPTFEKVYEVLAPRDARNRHDQYCAKNPSFLEVRSFHSSQCICDLGTKEATLCTFKSCGICSIVKSSFKSLAFGATSNQGRFGDGIYSYRNPALADQFATSCTSSPYRVMIACDVSLEPGQCDMDEVRAIDSGQGDEAGTEEHDQIGEEESLFVPSPDAILPVYVIMYMK
ncbi:hypothetical protein D9611_001976 [Ephemerocybe angulata]|uniref:PARP catalytic domain-containing protein n=1 Tax=Ephemerocybe angulata TaxID=980116 RepID=A0A8H5CIF8_9AGAR|nr:hypothetical protein D9611_001976 [Tulosesus angulatus]